MKKYSIILGLCVLFIASAYGQKKLTMQQEQLLFRAEMTVNVRNMDHMME